MTWNDLASNNEILDKMTINFYVFGMFMEDKISSNMQYNLTIIK